MMFSPEISLSSTHYFYSLLSLPSLFLHLLSHLWSFIAIFEISLPFPKFLTRFTLTHLHRWNFTRPLSHLSSWIGELSLDRWAGIGWWWVWNGRFVDRWVDRLGWSLVAPVMIFFEWVYSGGFQISSVVSNRWLGWWVWWPLLALVWWFVCVAVFGSVCVVLCDEPVLEVEGG